MPRKNAVLIVGIDSSIGRYVAASLAADGLFVLGTTRRRETLAENRLFLDLDDLASFQNVPTNVEAAILCAAESGYSVAENNPSSHRINVDAPMLVVQQLLAKDIFTVFLSTNAVFSGRSRPSEERDSPDPETAYGRQKAAAESRLRSVFAEANRADLLAIVRLTKVVSWHTPTLAQWASNWNAGYAIRPFTDLIFSPIGLDYVTRGLKQLLNRHCGGIFHFTGEEDISYADFALLLAASLHVPIAPPIEPIFSTDAGVSLVHCPRYAVMRSDVTRSQLGLEPQAVAEVIETLCEQRI